MPDEKDPWASLAESLGASPSGEPSPPPRPVEKPRQEPRQEQRPAAPRAAAPRAAQGWDDLDSSLGLQTSREPARPADRRPAEPSRAESSGRGERSERVVLSEGGASDGDRSREGGEPRGDGGETGDGRPRRRRGRRGGRGRGRGRRDREATTAPAARGDELGPRDADLEAEPLDELGEGRPAASGEPFERPPLDEEGRPRRRRRRRGRRGGRSGASAGERTADQGPDTVAGREPGDHLDDEPLPAGYGRSQTTRQPENRESGGRAAEGERRGRRRRGRGGDASRRPSAEGASESSSGSGRGRRGRRSADRDRDRDRTSSSSSLARRSRDDFAPVSRGYDEDDEGLEFLGVEDAVHEPPRREPRHAEDDVIAESGLDAVRDVPSWVEAIGIVIAGNLDARSRPRADRGDDDRRRR